MNRSTISILLSAMMAVSGLAVAQPAAPATDVKSGTQGGSGPSASDKAAPGTMSKSRSEVKAEAAPMKAGVDGGKGTTPDAKMTAAERRAAAGNSKPRTEVLHHRDPFDRLLVAQARCEGLTLVSADARLAHYDVALIDAST